MNDFDRISVNVSTGAVSYPQPEGFVLDQDALRRTVRLFAPHQPDVETCIRLAIHQQLSAFRGAASVLRRLAVAS